MFELTAFMRIEGSNGPDRRRAEIGEFQPSSDVYVWLCQLSRHEGKVDPLRSGLDGCHQPQQLGKPFLMDGPALRQCEGLVAVRLGTKKRPDLIKGATEACSRGNGFEPARGAIWLFDPSMVLLQMVV
jgi:hypothetical protein